MRIAEQAKDGPVVIDSEYVEREVQGAIAEQPSPEESPQPKEPTDDGQT